MDEHPMDVFRGQSLHTHGAFPDCPSIALQRTRATTIKLVPFGVVTECLNAHRAKDWQRLRELFHPEARIGVFAGGGAPRDPDDAIAAMEKAHETLVYQADIGSVRVLDDHAVVLKGYVQYRAKDERIIKTDKVWLYVVVDDKLFRSQVFETEAAALEAYRRLGIDLGVSSSP